MTGKSRFAFMTAMALLVFVFSAVKTIPAFADDSTPPPPVDAPTEVAPPVVADPIDIPIVVSTDVAPTDAPATDPAPVHIATPADVSAALKPAIASFQ